MTALLAHLSCRSITVNANFCRHCGKPLTENNTVEVPDAALPADLVHDIRYNAMVGYYSDLDEMLSGHWTPPSENPKP